MARTIVVDVDAVDPTRLEKIAEDIQEHYPNLSKAQSRRPAAHRILRTKSV